MDVKPAQEREDTDVRPCVDRFSLPVRASPGPSAFTLEASWEGSTFTWKGLCGTSCGGKQIQSQTDPEPETTRECVCVYLVCKQDFDSHFSSSRRNVLDRKCVVGVGDDVKVHVSLSVTDHVSITLNPHANVT